MQPHEFNALIVGYKWRQERQEDIAAYFVTALMNVSGKTLKKMVTVREMVKPLRQTCAPKNKAKDETYLKNLFHRRLNGGEKP